MWADIRGRCPHFIIMKRILSVSFDEEIWDKLREMRNSSDFVNSVVSEAMEGEKVNVDVCEICGSTEKPLIWVLPDEKMVCAECEKQMVINSKSKMFMCCLL